MSPDTALTVRTRRDIVVAAHLNMGSPAKYARRASKGNGSAYQGSPSSPHAVSPATGRVASGPWQGPYGSSVENGNNSPIYLDSSGSGHFSLESIGSEAPTTPVADTSMYH
ncbi:hypothetical protein WJX82_004401 [Trebouxia sp. C0006]